MPPTLNKNRNQTKNSLKRIKFLRKDLPPHYYKDHFEEILKFYCKVYGPDFHTEIFDLLCKYKTLDFSAKCLVIRAANRSKTFFTFKDFESYPEIQDVPTALKVLIKNEMMIEPEAGDLEDFLSQATKAQVSEMLNSSKISFKRSAARQDLIKLIDFPRNKEVHFPKGLYKLGPIDAYKKLLFSFFGSLRMDLKAFALKDLGLRQSGEFNIVEQKKFSTFKELESEYFYRDLELKANHSVHTKPLARAVLSKLILLPARSTEKAEEKYNKTLLILSRAKDLSRSDKLRLLEVSTAPPARLRYVRELIKDKDLEGASNRLKKIISDPFDDSELLEANDLLNVRFGRQKMTSLTKLLKESRIVKIDDSFRGSVEHGVKKALEIEGFEVTRTENLVWTGLFGLLFWDLLFGEKATSITNEFDRLPKDLSDKTFYAKFENVILARCNDLYESRTKHNLLKTFTQQYGKKNHIFRWKKSLLLKIDRILLCKSPAVVDTMIRMSKDFLSNSTGFPDLIGFKGKTLKLFEVKGEGDSIRKNQMVQINKLKKEGHPVEILRAVYTIDPMQTYVVVDVETTGGRSGNHRVTEIGAVKIKGSEVVGEFQALLNPQRSIPTSITKLTGISNEMVADAPLFSDVADDFRAFCEGSIFAAHFVQFDYSFIQSEFERIGERFHFPKFCTCAMSRKYLKGPARYGLAVICEHYGIELKSHHRALCDAKAAAEILLLINAKRTEEQDRMRSLGSDQT